MTIRESSHLRGTSTKTKKCNVHVNKAVVNVQTVQKSTKMMWDTDVKENPTFPEVREEEEEEEAGGVRLAALAISPAQAPSMGKNSSGRCVHVSLETASSFPA